MSSATAPERRPFPTLARPRGRASTALWVSYAILSVLLVVYVVSVVARSAGLIPGNAFWDWIDGWGIVVFEMILAGMLLARGFSRLPGRAVPLVLGAAVFAWALGDFVITWEGANPPTPSYADAAYVFFYPLAYAAIVLMLRKEIKRLLPATWLDGAIAGLGAAAVCAAFAFPSVLRLLGTDITPLGAAVNLVYPIGDVLLLALVVGGSAILPGRRLPWLLFATACAVNGVGDTFNLLSAELQVGTIADAIAWPIAIALMSMSVWVPPGRRDLFEAGKMPGFVLPEPEHLPGSRSCSPGRCSIQWD